MEKKYLYTAPAVRFLALHYDESFLTTYNGGTIDDGDEEDWGELV